MSILPASPDLPPLTRWEPPIEELVDLRPDRPASEVLRGRMSRSRADELCLERYGRTFKEEREYRRE